MKQTNFPRRKEKRKIDAGIRAKEVAELSPKERLARLDVTLGNGVGAKKERARFTALMNKPAAKLTKSEYVNKLVELGQELVTKQSLRAEPGDNQPDVPAKKPKKKAKDRREEEGKS